MLARALHVRNSLASIPELKDWTDQVIHYPKAINGLFCAFYNDLYNLPSHPSTMTQKIFTSCIVQYITDIALPTLSDLIIQVLDRPISEEEVATAIFSLKNNKNPGPMVYTAQF